MQRSSEKGFTLVELSIVLVIIGLIVGGVLVGQDLIQAARIRAQITQLQQFDAAVGTFQAKYDGMPGDFERAAVFITGATSGDGDNELDDSTDTAAPTSTFTGEVADFWVQLSTTGMIPGTYDGSTTIDAGYPEGRLGGGIVAYSDTGNLFYYYGMAGTVGGALNAGTAAALSPLEAYGIDSKLDDGDPLTGGVLARDALDTAAAAGAGNCQNSGDYTIAANEDTVLCELRITATR